MDKYSLPIVAIIDGSGNQATKEDADIARKLGEIIVRLGIRTMTKWRNRIYDAMVLGANKYEKAPFVTSLDNNDQLTYQVDPRLSLDRTYALYLVSASIIIFPGGLESLVDAAYLIWLDAHSAPKKPLMFWGEGCKTIIEGISNHNFFNESQTSQIIILKELEDIEKRLSQLVRA